ncbi:MAG: PQQ-binding-like beta-propeller repeat protein [Tepidiformaceae bacterium]
MTRLTWIGSALVTLALAGCGGGGGPRPAVTVAPSLAPSQPVATESPPTTPTPTKGLPTPPWAAPWLAPEHDQWVWVRAEPGLLLLSYGGEYACCDNFSLRSGGVAAVDPKNGHELWRVGTAAQAFPAVLVGDTVVFGTGDGTVFGLDASTGRTLWQKIFAGIPFQVLTAGSTVVVADADPEVWGPGGMVDKTRLAGRVAGLNPATGETRWETKVGAFSALAATNGDTLVVAAAQGVAGAEIAAFDTSTGSERWRQATEHVPSPPVVAGKLVLIPGARLSALELASGKQVWSAAPANGDIYFPRSA